MSGKALRLIGAMVATVVALGCDEATGPSSLLYQSYFLATVNDAPLPVPYGTDGTMLLSSTLAFGDVERPRSAGPVGGMVRMIAVLERANHQEETSTVDLSYVIDGSTLRINLCPPLAECLVASELVGTITGRTSDLVLHYVGPGPGTVYRYVPALPD